MCAHDHRVLPRWPNGDLIPEDIAPGEYCARCNAQLVARLTNPYPDDRGTIVCRCGYCGVPLRLSILAPMTYQRKVVMREIEVTGSTRVPGTDEWIDTVREVARVFYQSTKVNACPACIDAYNADVIHGRASAVFSGKRHQARVITKQSGRRA